MDSLASADEAVSCGADSEDEKHSARGSDAAGIGIADYECVLLINPNDRDR